MDYKEAQDYINSIPRFAGKNSVETTRAFYERLGKPAQNSKMIHVAGTNGKGSVCAYLNGILTEAGFHTGMFISPHLVTMQERFQINGTQITEEVFLQLFHRVLKEVKAVQEEGSSYHPAFFEFLFFMGMLLFEEEKVEYLLLETGLGGRLDATNVIENPLVTVITSIGMDHTQYLGNTLAQIAAEKAGIMKAGVPCVYAEGTKEVSGVFKKRGKELPCPMEPVLRKSIHILKNTDKTIDFSIESKYYNDISLTVSCCAAYQCVNVAVAVKTIEAAGLGPHITKEQIQKAVMKTRWQGRMEEILPGVFVDGGHNPSGIQAFMQSAALINEVHTGQNHLLFGVVKDKDYREMTSILMRKHMFHTVTLTKIPGEREVELSKLQALFTPYLTDVQTYESVEEAFKACLLLKKEQDRLYIAGSLYLVGLIKEILEKQ